MPTDARVALPVVPPEDATRCGLIGEHAEMQSVYRLISVAAPTQASVLVLGEPGSGRTAVARCIHRNSTRASGPWLVLRLGGLSPQEAADALFGEEHETGLDTIERRSGRLEQARGGTLYLEDITALSLSNQARLVMALRTPPDEGRRLGDAPSADCRIIASARRDIRPALAEGAFRDDLYFTLAVVTVPVPALRARGDDLLLLLAHFLGLAAGPARAGRPPLTGISAAALRSLQAHPWHDNLPELQTMAKAVAAAAEGDTVELTDLPLAFRHDHEAVTQAPEPELTAASLAAVEAEHIARVLKETHGLIQDAAAILGVHRNTLARKIRLYGLDARDDR